MGRKILQGGDIRLLSAGTDFDTTFAICRLFTLLAKHGLLKGLLNLKLRSSRKAFPQLPVKRSAADTGREQDGGCQMPTQSRMVLRRLKMPLGLTLW